MIKRERLQQLSLRYVYLRKHPMDVLQIWQRGERVDGGGFANLAAALPFPLAHSCASRPPQPSPSARGGLCSPTGPTPLLPPVHLVHPACTFMSQGLHRCDSVSYARILEMIRDYSLSTLDLLYLCFCYMHNLRKKCIFVVCLYHVSRFYKIQWSWCISQKHAFVTTSCDISANIVIYVDKVLIDVMITNLILSGYILFVDCYRLSTLDCTVQGLPLVTR